MNELVQAFKDAWHAADERGESGLRTEAGVAAVLAKIDAALLEAAPSPYAELSMRGGDGPFTDPGMSGYVDGFSNALRVVREFATPGNEETTHD